MCYIALSDEPPRSLARRRRLLPRGGPPPAAVEPRTTGAAAPGDVQAAAIRAHMEFLADDLLEGRGTATRGHEIAARYVAAQFAAAGLEPGADGRWLQSVPMRRSRLDAAASRVEIVRPGGARSPLAFGRDYVMGSGFERSTDVEAPVVFAGYGVTAAELRHDDYDGLDARGKIVAFLAGAPAAFGNDEHAYHADAARKARNAAAHGAVGTLRLWSAEEERAGPWSVVVRSVAGAATFAWLEAGAPHDAIPELRGNAWLGPEGSQALFASSGIDFAEASAKAAPAELPLRVRIARQSAFEDVESPNVVALLPGSDPRLRHEHVVLTAHLDHLGIGEPVDGDAIYNGAVDNASGVAALIEIARAFAALPERPRRSLLFVAFTAEEPGALGSDYFVHHPPVPLASIVANLNIDGASVWPFEALIPRGAELSTLARAAEAGAAAAGERLAPDPFPERMMFLGSDQYSFVKRGIPALNVGATRTAAARPQVLDWLNRRYHAPSDDMQQPLDFAAAARYARALFFITRAAAQADERPHWNPGNFYGERFGSPATRTP